MEPMCVCACICLSVLSACVLTWCTRQASHQPKYQTRRHRCLIHTCVRVCVCVCVFEISGEVCTSSDFQHDVAIIVGISWQQKNLNHTHTLHCMWFPCVWCVCVCVCVGVCVGVCLYVYLEIHLELRNLSTDAVLNPFKSTHQMLLHHHASPCKDSLGQPAPP